MRSRNRSSRAAPPHPRNNAWGCKRLQRSEALHLQGCRFMQTTLLIPPDFARAFPAALILLDATPGVSTENPWPWPYWAALLAIALTVIILPVVFALRRRGRLSGGAGWK